MDSMYGDYISRDAVIDLIENLYYDKFLFDSDADELIGDIETMTGYEVKDK